MSKIDILHVEFDRSTAGSFQYTFIDKTTGLPMNLTGYTLTLDVRSEKSGAIVFSGGVFAVTPLSGLVKVSFTAADFATMASIEPVRYSYDLYGSFAGGTKGKLLIGLFTLTDSAPF